MTMVNTRSQKRRGMPKRATHKNLKNRNTQTKRKGQQKGGMTPVELSVAFNKLKKVQDTCGQNLNFVASEKKPDKNRYTNIHATDATIVKLSGGNDYINANYITLGGPEQKVGGLRLPFSRKKGKNNQQQPKQLTIKVDKNKPVEVPLSGDTIHISDDNDLILIVPGIGQGTVNLGNYEDFLQNLKILNKEVKIDGEQKTIKFNIPPIDLIESITKQKHLKELGSFAKLEKQQFDYIATQGPKPTTIDDFWKMVVENDVNCIVMVTGLVEKGTGKCEDYFNSTGDVNSSFKYINNNIEFKLTKKEDNVKGDNVKEDNVKEDNVKEDNVVYEERTFIYYLKNGEPKTVTHLWFRKWPDRDVPDEGDFMELLKRFNELKKASPGTFKPLVHCSAGVGRTGTFIVLDHILYDKQCNLRTDLDLSTDEAIPNLMDGTICQLRQQRNKLMVQTEAQYKFIYEVINKQLSNRDRTNSGIGNSGFSNKEEEPLPVVIVEIFPYTLSNQILLLFNNKDVPNTEIRIKINDKDNFKRGKLLLNEKKETLFQTTQHNEENTTTFITYKMLEKKLIDILKNSIYKYNLGGTGVNLTIDPNNLMVNFPENTEEEYSMSEPLHLSVVVEDALKQQKQKQKQQHGGRKSKSNAKTNPKTRTKKQRSTKPKNKRTRKSKK